jgi:hypothetical protein
MQHNALLSASPSGDTSLNGYRFAVQRYSLDNSWRRPKKGNVLIAGSPLRIFRLSAAGQKIAESLEQTGEAPVSGQLLVTRLIDAGALHPLPSLEGNAPTLTDISIVIPLFARSENDIARRNAIANLLEEWGLVTLVDKKKSSELVANINQIKILPHKEKQNWRLESKYNIGKKK